jgi:hypothetical protein
VTSSADLEGFLALRKAGATMRDVAVILSVVAEVDRAIIDLAAWEHEARGKGGKWTRGNPVVHPLLQPQEKPRAAGLRPQTSMAEIGPGPNPAVRASMDQPATMRHLAKAQAQTLQIAQEAARSAAAHAVKQATELHQEHMRQEDIAEGKKSNKKFWAVTASLVGGAVAGLVEAKLGVPDVAVALSTISPALAEAMFEKKYRL